MDETLKQRFRQPFGFYMENLIGKDFQLSGFYTMYHAHSHAYEWGLDLNDIDLTQLKFLLNILGTDREELKKHVLNILSNKETNYSNDYIEVIKKIFSGNEKAELLEKKITLLAVSNIVGSNNVEFLRIQNHKLIVSEIKSQYGPKVDYRIEFEEGQLEKLLKLTNNGIDATLLYCIALPEPRFVEIAVRELYKEFMKFKDFNGEEFITNNWSNLRIRIPRKYREEEKFKKIDKSLYHFHDEVSLYNAILNAFPGKFTRLNDFLINANL